MRNWPYLHSDDHIYSLPTIREILNRFRNRFRKNKPPDPMQTMFDTDDPRWSRVHFSDPAMVLIYDSTLIPEDEDADAD